MKTEILLRFDYDRPARVMSREEASAAIRAARAIARHATGTSVRFDARAHSVEIHGPAATCTLQPAPEHFVFQ